MQARNFWKRLLAWLRKLQRYPLVGYAQSILLVLVITVIGIPIHWVIEPVNLVMFYLVGVVLVAIYLGRGPAMLASLLSVLAFDFFMVQPRLSFRVADSQYLLTFLGLLMVGLVISSSAEMIRAQVKKLRSREAHLDALNSLSRELTRALSLEDVLGSVLAIVGKVFNRPLVILLPGAAGLQPVAASPGLELNLDDLEAANQAFQQHQPQRGGTLYCLPLETVHGTVGIIGLRSGDVAGVITPEQIQHLEGFASLVALAIERARLAEQASQAKILEKTEQLQAALLNSISHELRTPLVTITGTLSTLAELQQEQSASPADPSALREMVDTAYEEAQRLNLLVGNLLDMTRLEAGAFHLHLEPCDIQDLVGIALRRFVERRNSHMVRVSLPENLPLVSIDVALMTQVLMNLLDNAAKYSPEQSPIELRGVQEGDTVVLSVLDQGIGIPEADLSRIFDKFYRTSISNGISGVGLGLSISNGIVEAHGGHMWAENHPGGGSMLSLALPIEKPGAGAS